MTEIQTDEKSEYEPVKQSLYTGALPGVFETGEKCLLTVIQAGDKTKSELMFLRQTDSPSADETLPPLSSENSRSMVQLEMSVDF